MFRPMIAFLALSIPAAITPPPASGAAAEGVAGKWDVVVTYGEEPIDYSLELEQEGESVRGGLISPRSGRHAIREGSFKNGVLTLGIPRQLEGQDVLVRIEARLQGDALAGTVALGDFATGTFKATRARPAAAAAPAKQPAGPSPVGSWRVTTETQGGRQYESRMVIEAKEGRLGGTVVSQLGAIELRSVAAEGKKFRFAITLPIEGNDVEFLIEAEFAGNDRLEGRWRAAADANVSGSWIAQRETPAAAIGGSYRLEAIAPNGDVIRYDMELEEKEGAVRGALIGPDGGRFEIRDGRYAGGELSFRIEVVADGENRRARCSARFDAGGKLSGRWETDNDSGTWTARRTWTF